ncbi:hypothetical protein FEK35_28495 [Nocardia cyriacigeorgica]|uniref:Mce-associated membrane protein n=1 Tax=Nocardia cyriacigeorgica TaxID=135487 RepID=A0A5R8P6B8_9NOCA|nr:hypothetical protein [Nocardia cyriacigeorgica]TLF94951.1 hypothetical protein FEK35_28495 [Nocardia cyriacigeorgica]
MHTLDKTSKTDGDENTTATNESSDARTDAKSARPKPDKRAVTLSLSAPTLIASVVAVVLLLVSGTLSVLLWQSRSDLTDTRAAAADEQHAEQVASDYAVGAATINYQDFNSWVAKLKANTVPQLSNTFDATAPKLQELMVPLQWTSTAQPIAAKVESVTGSVYKVDVFVNVNSTNTQNPQGAQTTVTYSVTVDKNADWKITDVGGTAAALPLK